jgi:hypothetical protein
VAAHFTRSTALLGVRGPTRRKFSIRIQRDLVMPTPVDFISLGGL